MRKEKDCFVTLFLAMTVGLLLAGDGECHSVVIVDAFPVITSIFLSSLRAKRDNLKHMRKEKDCFVTSFLAGDAVGYYLLVTVNAILLSSWTPFRSLRASFYRHCERQRSNLKRMRKEIDCFVTSLLAMTAGGGCCLLSECLFRHCERSAAKTGAASINAARFMNTERSGAISNICKKK